MSEAEDKSASQVLKQKFDKLSAQERSALMAKIHGKDTKPEKIVRKALFQKGFRYRKNVDKMPGKPDIVLPKYKAVIFVHGCFWHQHEGCKAAVRPRSRVEYWNVKLDRNIERDALNLHKLEELGWRVFIVWECEIRPRQRDQTIRLLIENLRLLKTASGKC